MADVKSAKLAGPAVDGWCTATLDQDSNVYRRAAAAHPAHMRGCAG
jgi:hypothetical protein